MLDPSSHDAWQPETITTPDVPAPLLELPWIRSVLTSSYVSAVGRHPADP
jgi:hypothetical protein